MACGCHLFWKRVPFHVRGRSTRVYPELGQTPGIPGYYSTRVYPESAQVPGIHGYYGPGRGTARASKRDDNRKPLRAALLVGRRTFPAWPMILTIINV